MGKRMIKYTFYQNDRNIDRPGKNREPFLKITEEKNEGKIIGIRLEKISSLYGEDRIIASFMKFLIKQWNEMFLYINHPEVKKTSDKAEQHFSIHSWQLKHRSKTKGGC